MIITKQWHLDTEGHAFWQKINLQFMYDTSVLINDMKVTCLHVVIPVSSMWIRGFSYTFKDVMVCLQLSFKNNVSLCLDRWSIYSSCSSDCNICCQWWCKKTKVTREACYADNCVSHQPFWFWIRNIPGHLHQYVGCWCDDPLHLQFISIDSDIVIYGYSCLAWKRI